MGFCSPVRRDKREWPPRCRLRRPNRGDDGRCPVGDRVASGAEDWRARPPPGTGRAWGSARPPSVACCRSAFATDRDHQGSRVAPDPRLREARYHRPRTAPSRARRHRDRSARSVVLPPRQASNGDRSSRGSGVEPAVPGTGDGPPSGEACALDLEREALPLRRGQLRKHRRETLGQPRAAFLAHRPRCRQ